MADPRKFMRVATELREVIADGTLKPDEAITIGELARKHGVDRATVAKAFRLLASEGLLERWPGLGYYVTSPGTWPADGGGPANG
jgi:DNA-binding GntR family transcriptional regulator